MNLTLVRELDFGKPVHSVAFANPRGDLLIGFQGEVSLIKMQDCILFILNNFIQFSSLSISSHYHTSFVILNHDRTCLSS